MAVTSIGTDHINSMRRPPLAPYRRLTSTSCAEIIQIPILRTKEALPSQHSRSTRRPQGLLLSLSTLSSILADLTLIPTCSSCLRAKCLLRQITAPVRYNRFMANGQLIMHLVHQCSGTSILITKLRYLTCLTRSFESTLHLAASQCCL